MEREYTADFNTCSDLKEVNHIANTFVDAFGPLEVKCQHIQLVFKKTVGHKPETTVTRADTGKVYTNVSKFCQ